MTSLAYLHPSQVEVTLSGDEIADLTDERADCVEALKVVDEARDKLALALDRLDRRILSIQDRMDEARVYDPGLERDLDRQQADREERADV